MSLDNIKVLVVEDEASIRKFIKINLIRDGFIVLEAESGEDALRIIDMERPNVVVLDIMLPGIDGYEVCQRIREKNMDTIVVMLTARGQDMDKIMGLDLGADDYMVKPFNPLELVARIRAIIRRTDSARVDNKNTIECEALKMDLKAQKFLKGDYEIELTPTEFLILKAFMQNPGKAFSRDEILDSVWGEDYFGETKTVDVHIRRIREKIEDNPSRPEFIETVWGFGYRWRGEK